MSKYPGGRDCCDKGNPSQVPEKTCKPWDFAELRSQPRDRLVVTRFGSESKGLVNLILFQFQLFPGNGHLDLYAKSATPSPPFCCPFILASPRAQERKRWKKGVHVFAAWEPCPLPSSWCWGRVGPLHASSSPFCSVPEIHQHRETE